MKIARIKNLIITVLFALVLVLAATLSGCVIETAHPSAVITVEFNGGTYELKYTLYRNMYPQTVRHFIELADAGFYDNTIVHDYTGSDWYTGGYSYDESYVSSVSGNNASLYLENYSKEDAYYELFNSGALTPSVYKYYGYDDKGNQTVDADDALPTLMGEFYDNIKQEIKNGALSESYGCLKMYYNAKTTTQRVYVTPTSDQIIAADYKNNSATSVFMIQTGTSSTSYKNSSYCIFAELKDTEPLDNLVKAIADYLEDKSMSSSDFTVKAETTVDNNDTFSEVISDRYITDSFTMTKEPLKIVTVKVTGY